MSYERIIIKFFQNDFFFSKNEQNRIYSKKLLKKIFL